MIETAVTRAPLDGPALLARVGGEEDGAVLLFLGVVRNHNEGRRVHSVEYEGYEEMARKELAAIAEEASARFALEHLVVHHRLGRLTVGEVSVVVAASSPHRGPAFDAVRMVMEEIKKRLPVWKKEGYEDGDSGWVAGVRPEPRGGTSPG